MVLDRVSPISKHGDEAIPGHEPAENPDIRSLQLPYCILFGTNDPELPCKDQRLTAQERMEKIVNLFCRRRAAENSRRLCAGENILQPCREWRRPVKQPHRLIARPEFDLDL